MQVGAATAVHSEQEFAAIVDRLAVDPGRRHELLELFAEDHPLYDQRGAATVVRMRGWVLVALSRSTLTDAALLFVLEELDTGTDAYLIAAAARALRSYPAPSPTLAPYVMRALNNVRNHDEPVLLDGYGEYATSTDGTSAVRELLATLIWLGPHAAGVATDLVALRALRAGGLSKRLSGELDKAIDAVKSGGVDQPAVTSCCTPTGLGWRSIVPRDPGRVKLAVFEDHTGTPVSYEDCFTGHPSIVAFFYTRCDNPLKCSLTVTKLARVQALLKERGMAGRIHTAAISYDPGFDLPARLARYGRDRGLALDAANQMLRAIEGMDDVRGHFKLGVNFVGSLVNRHRIEVYVLDRRGRIAASFERLHWDEQQVVDRAIEVMDEKRGGAGTPLVGTVAAVGVAFFPKCAFCWATYMSVFGVGVLQEIPYAPWLQPLLAALMLTNLVSAWLRGRATAHWTGFYLVAVGAGLIVLARSYPQAGELAIWGVMVTLIGSAISVLVRSSAVALRI
jgi:protein SCO1/2